MRFQTPQFIEIEDKIVGPLTIKQFVYLAGGAGICFVLYRFLPLFVAILLIVPVATLSLALAFYKINNRPFIVILESIFKFGLSKRLYIWKKIPKEVKVSESKKQNVSNTNLPRLSKSKLKDMQWSLGVKENENPVTGPNDPSLRG